MFGGWRHLTLFALFAVGSNALAQDSGAARRFAIMCVFNGPEKLEGESPFDQTLVVGFDEPNGVDIDVTKAVLTKYPSFTSLAALKSLRLDPQSGEFQLFAAGEGVRVISLAGKVDSGQLQPGFNSTIMEMSDEQGRKSEGSIRSGACLLLPEARVNGILNVMKKQGETSQ